VLVGAAVVSLAVFVTVPGAGPARPAPSFASSTTSSSATTPVVRVSGNELVDGAGRPLRLVGVDRSGTEYACVQGWGIFDGPSDASSISAIASWHADAVRLPLNEDCWLGINGVNPAYSGTNYRQAVEAYVQRLHAAGMAVILDLHWNAPGTALATGQQVMADADHAPAFWSSVAGSFRSDAGVVFDLYNEPHDISWSCWLSGCTTSAGWRAAGMQQLLDAVRNTGATQPVMVAGLNWAGDLSGWLSHEPVDPQHQLVASAHIYDYSQCNTSTCWQQTVAPVAGSVPVVTGELGETDCASGFISSYMSWADSAGVSYLGWSWDTANCSSGPALISSYDGTPTNFGAGFKSHITALAASSSTFAPGTSSGTSSSGSGAQLQFENGNTNGWKVEWGSNAAVAPGSQGLALELSGTGYPGFFGTQGLTGLAPGDTVTYKIDDPSGVPLQIVPFAQDGSWAVHFAPATTLAAGWNTVAWTVPPESGVSAIGLQVNDSSNFSGQLILGSAGW
jgi:hypothetical protein